MSTDLVLKLQEEMSKFPQLELPTQHFFADGMYARSLFRPAGTLIVGKQHKREHFYIVVTGKVQVGQNTYGPGTVVVSGPGTKRAVLALEDSLCITVHRTNKKNLDKIERELIEPDPKALFDARNKLKELPCPG
jgi:hypothetical protein